MTREQLERLQTVGAAVRAPTAQPEVRADIARAEALEAVRELREVLTSGMTPAMREELERHDRRRARAERKSGWRQTPQCGGCKRILSRPDAVCPSCGYAGHGGYVGVPAKTSYLERWH